MSPHQIAPIDVIEELRSQIRGLQDRLANVENQLGIQVQTARPAPAGEIVASPSSWGDTGSMAALLGKSLLGLALAFLLRALSESGSIPVALGVGLGISYALLWLVWAARTPASETATVSLRALTAVLVVVPLLWEAQIRFHALESWTNAVMLVVFAVSGLVISWSKNLLSVAWITSLAGIGACLALLVRTQDLLPFTAALLLMALAVEVSGCLEHYLGERWVVALAVDLAILLVTVVATRPPGAAEGYTPLPLATVLTLQVALVTIYLSSTIVRTLLRSFHISGFEIAQSATALLVAGWGAIKVSAAHPEAVLIVGAFLTLCGAACYVVSLSFLDHGEERDRNFHAYATFGIALTLAGTWLLLRDLPRIAFWSVLPVLCVLVGRRAGRSTLKAHAAVTLLLASVVSGAAGFANSRFLSESAHLLSLPTLGMVLVTASAFLCYGLLARGAPPEGAGFVYRGASLVLAATAAWLGGGVATVLLMPLCRSSTGQAPHADYCPTLIMALLIAIALGLSYLGREWGRAELRWVSLLLTAAATYKLVFQDFRQDHTFALVLSMAAYGLCLIVLPRLGQKPPSVIAAGHS